YPRIVAAASRIKGSAIIDAEAVYLDAKGRAQFDLLHSRLNDHVAIATAFDLLMLNGEDMRRANRTSNARRPCANCFRRNEDIQGAAHMKGGGAKCVRGWRRTGRGGQGHPPRPPRFHNGPDCL